MIKTISIIIPVLNEVEQIAATLAQIPTGVDVDVIVVDGGSRDGTIAQVQALGIPVITTAAGRARQMNAGATAATGEILLFLHADTRLPEGFAPVVRQILSQPGTIAGAFRLKIDAPNRGLQLIETGVNCRSQVLQMPYGDQGLFLPADLFHKAGGFPDLPIMEDFALVRRLRQQGKIALAPLAVTTSARRWRRVGLLKTTLINQAIVLAYLLGVAPDRLATWYRRR